MPSLSQTLLPLLALLWLAAASPLPAPGPQSSVRVSFVSPPHAYSHGLDSPVSRVGVPRGRARLQPQPSRRAAPRGMTLALVTSLAPEPTQHPGYVINRPAQRLPRTFDFSDGGRDLSNSLRDPEAMWPMGVFLPPDHDLQLVHLPLGAEESHQLFAEPEATPDPFLRTGQDAVQVVRYLFSLGELFFDKYPHSEVLLRHQQERMDNGLAGNKLGSIRPESPFYRWPVGRRAQFVEW